MSTDKFIMRLAGELINSVNNNYDDNYDPYRFGKKTPEIRGPVSLKSAFISILNDKGFYNNFNNYLVSKQIGDLSYPITDFIYLHNLLVDNYSKELLIKIVAYRILGHKKVKLPLNTPEFWNNQDLIEANQSTDDLYSINFMEMKLPLTNLNFLGVPIQIYYSALGLNLDFIIKQYELHRDTFDIEAKHGDVVIDGGACYGDTALYFANKVGSTGNVYAFEFIPENIDLFNKNIKLNPALDPIIELVDRPLWNESDQEVFYLFNGPGSKVSLDEFEDYTGKTTSITIDDFVISKGLKKVDFIKMDIEGAEPNALKGAKQTIERFKPTLAIALYHCTKDFDSIPRFINELNLGYKFYLSHATIYAEETMLFAIASE